MSPSVICHSVLWVSIQSFWPFVASNDFFLLYSLMVCGRGGHCMTCFSVLFVSERMVIGFNCTPMVFAADDRGIWYAIFFGVSRIKNLFKE